MRCIPGIREHQVIRSDQAQASVRQRFVDHEVLPGEQVDAALRALADHYADTGQTAAAITTYEELLEKVRASRPQLEADLRHANHISRIYRDLGSLHRRAGHATQAGTLDQQRLELWRYWDRKLPNNPFVRRQLAAAAIR